MKIAKNNKSNYWYRCLGTVWLCLSALVVWGQNMTITSVDEYSPNYANLEGTMVMDPNNMDKKTALLLIESPIKDRILFLDIGSLQEVKREKKDGLLWVYIQGGAKRLTIRCEGYNATPTYSYSFKEARTYLVKLDVDQVAAGGYIDPTKTQVLHLQVYPSDARVILGGRPQTLVDGKTTETFQQGSLHYYISAPMYHHREGYINMDGKDSIKAEFLRLKQAFGWLKIEGKDLNDVTVAVDDTITFNASKNESEYRVLSGRHNVKVRKPLKAVWERDVEIVDSLTTTLSPTFIDDYAHYSFSTDKNAVIYIDGESKGKGSWQGDLGAGEHMVECKIPSHRTTSRKFTVVKGKDEKMVLDSPEPIYATFSVNTDPAGADVYVDGTKIGSTPWTNNQKILVGEHKIRIEKQGYRIEESTQNLQEGVPCNLFERLTNVVLLKIKALRGTYVEFPNGDCGYTPFVKNVSLGDYDVKLIHRGYYTQKRTLHVDATHSYFNFKMKRILFRKSGGYIEGVAQVGSMTGYGGNIGMYIKDFNVEATYLLGSEESEEIWWNATNSEGNPYYPCSIVYKPTYIGAKVGYGFLLANWLRLTPQVGGGVVKLAGEYQTSGWVDGVENTYMVSATLGLRFHMALTSWLGLSVTPEYSAKVKTAGQWYDQMADISSKINSWGNGLNCRVGLNLFF